MELLTREAADAAKVRLMNPLQMAYMGDTVWEMLVRSRLMDTGHNVHKLHLMATRQVNATAQSRAAQAIQPLLTPDEADIFRRGRNAHARHAAPKHQDPAAYAAATGLEALMGYLYLTGQDERLCRLFQEAQESLKEE